MKPTRLALGEHCYSAWDIMLAEGETIETAMQPDFWSHVAKSLRIGDEIRVTAYDRSWVARLYVRAVSKIEAVTGLLEMVAFEGAATVARADEFPYEAKFRGPRKWSAVHKKTGEVLKEDMQTAEEAAQWLKNYERNVAA